MKYGFFDDACKEYVIERPDTPLPWINYLGNKDFIGLISNTAGGYAFYRDARLQRLTRFRYNNVPADTGGRYYYIKEKGKKAWNPGFLPMKTALDEYKCRHGLGYSIFESKKDNLSCRLTCFVPLDENCELHRLTLKNESDTAKQLTLYSFIEWCLWDAVDDSENYQRNLNIAEIEVEDNVIYHKTEYRERRSHYAFFGVNRDISGFDTDRDVFLGPLRGFSEPLVVEEEKSQNSIAHGWYPCASHEIKLELLPGETEELIFILGYVENSPKEKWESEFKNNIINKSKAKQIMTRFATSESVVKEFNALSDYWQSLLSRFKLDSGNVKLNRMVNIWHQYQCMTTFNLSRSASYFESGIGRGMGFRDSCQDILGFVHLIPERARERILDLASVQREDGSTYHQYQPLTKMGNHNIGSNFNDDPLWLIAATVAYIKETGDSKILLEDLPFDMVKGTEASLFEHLRRSVQYTLGHLGPHGLPLIGRADWNDCLNLNSFSTEPGESFQSVDNKESGVAESIFIAAMFVLYGEQYAELCQRFGGADGAKEAKLMGQELDKMRNAIYEHGWDGEWFLRAYNAFGEKVGSQSCKEGKIYIEPQGFCVMAKLGLDNGMAEQALDSMHDHLLGDFGVELLSPCYTKYYKELGEISSYPPGYKENGSIFCHNNPWASIAETKLGRGDEAFDLYRRICPAYLEKFSEIHRTEPYVYSQTIAGRSSSSYGEAKNSWLTGTAAWTFVNISQAILGIKPDYDGLKIEPCLPKEISSYKVERFFRGCTYKISIERIELSESESNKIKTKIFVDGEELSAGTQQIPIQDKVECEVLVQV